MGESKSKKKPATKREEIVEAKNVTTLVKASAVSIEPALASISKLSIQTTSNLAKISEDLLSAHNEYTTLVNACDLKTQELSELGQRIEEQLSFNEEKAQHQVELDRLAKDREDIASSNDDLMAQLAETRERENEEYTYNLARQRKADTDQWADDLRQRQNAERDRAELLEKDHKLRNEALAAKETEYQAAIAKLATFDAVVKKEVDAEVAKTVNAIKSQFEHKAALATVENNATINSLKKDVESATTTLQAARLEAQNLRVELQKAYESVTGLANKTVEGANNKQAQLDAMAMINNIGSPNGSRTKSS